MLEQTGLSQTLAGSDRDLWERALTWLEKLHPVVNYNEAGTEETGLDTEEQDNRENQSCFI